MPQKSTVMWRFTVVLALIFAGSGRSLTQTVVPPQNFPSCSRANALEIAQQQINITKTIDDDAQRVAVLLRAADLIWLYAEEKARKAYAEAFTLAKQQFKEKKNVPDQDGKLLIGKPDLRYSVISAIARHDAKWSKKLAAELLKEQEDEAANDSSNAPQNAERNAGGLLTAASSLLASDEVTSLSFARTSLKYPATMYLAQFLYALAARNPSAADQFYQEALATYANVAMERLLYLSAYPFGNNRDAGDMPSYMMYQVRAGLAPNAALQRLFVQTVLGRVQRFIANPSDLTPGTRRSDPEEMWLALTRLEKQIQQTLPDLAPAVESARNNVAARLTPASNSDLQNKVGRENQPVLSFDEQVEAALKNPNVDVRDQRLTSAVINSSKDESTDDVLQVIDKISDSNIRQPLLNWFFFDRSQRAVKEQRLDDARKFADKVEELDQRAFLYSRIAEETFKEDADQTRTRAMLESIVEAAERAPNSTIKARALLAVAHLYTKVDMNRAVVVISEAIDCVNKIENADFNREFVIRKIEGKTFGMYATVVTAGYKPETALAEIATVDFDNMLS